MPWDDSHVVYVWFDALLNYVTAVGYGQDDDEFDRRWPATHLVGKDIARFHAVIWPAMLMAAGLEVPKQVFGHGWLLVGGEKMSKSKLTGIAPTEITDTFGSDAFRYYFMRAISFGQDGSFSWEDLSARYQAELANGFGNLASRVIAMVTRYFDGVVPAAAESTEADLAHPAPSWPTPPTDADAAIERLAIHDALAAIWTIVDELNGYITDQEPWVLAKDDEQPRAARHRAVHRRRRAARARRAALAGAAGGDGAKLWTALGAATRSARSTTSASADAGTWGQLPPARRSRRSRRCSRASRAPSTDRSGRRRFAIERPSGVPSKP